MTTPDFDEELLKPEVPFRQVVGSLSYLADLSRPDISFAVNKLAQSLSKPKEGDWKLAKHIMRYLRGTTKLGVLFQYGTSKELPLIGYSDSDFAGDLETSKSTSGYIIMYNGSPFHWKTQLQRHVTLSSTEAEVIAISELAKQLLWIAKMMVELGMKEDKPVVIRCDNTSAIRIMKSERASTRTRHLRARNDFTVELIKLQQLNLQHVPASQQLADILTKMVQTSTFIKNRDAILTTI